MHDAAGSPLAAWDNFYVIIGSSAAALIGLQFVVIALLKDIRRRSTTKEIDTFATPTILHFCAALLLSSILNAPWPSLSSVGVALGICGTVGVGYVVIVIRRARAQTTYKLVMEDWIWHLVLPFVAYAALFVAALALGRRTLASLFVIAGTALLLLYIGIHNAWDTVTFLALEDIQSPDKPGQSN